METWLVNISGDVVFKNYAINGSLYTEDQLRQRARGSIEDYVRYGLEDSGLDPKQDPEVVITSATKGKANEWVVVAEFYVPDVEIKAETMHDVLVIARFLVETVIGAQSGLHNRKFTIQL